MLDETNPIADNSTPVTETPKTEQDEGPVSVASPFTQDEQDADAVEDVGAPDGEDAIEYAEIELNGKKYQVPAELKDGYLMQADYTRKTQATAELTRQYEAKVADANRILEVSQEEMRARAHVLGLDAELAQYANVDWNRLEADDPISAQSHFRRWQMLKDQKASAEGFINSKANERTQLTQQDTARRLEETRQFAEKNIKGWNEGLDAQITEFAVKELGFTRDTLQAAYTPAVYRALYLAHIGQQTLSRSAAAPGLSAGGKPQIKPLTTVSAKASGMSSKDPSEMSMAEYDKWAASKFKGK